MITGTSTSRLSELRKYTLGGVFFDNYKKSSSISNNGVNVSLSNITSTPQKIVYYVDKIAYVDVISNGIVRTTFSFMGQGYDSPDFVDLPIYKDPEKNNIISSPKIFNDVFIDRQVISAFDDLYKLNDVESLNELLIYAGGKYFNVIENS